MSIGNGWTDSPLINIINNQLCFSGEEMTINEETLIVSSRAISVESTFIYNGIDIGLVLWYNNTGHIKYVLSPQGLSVARYYEGNTLNLKNYTFSTDGDILAPQAGEVVILKAEIYRTNIKCYLGDRIIFNLEQNAFSQGSFGIFGTENAKCTRFVVKSNGILNWNRHIEDGCICIRDKEGIRFSNAALGYSYVSQQVPTINSSLYTVSIPYKGNLHVEIYNGATLLTSKDGLSEQSDILIVSFTAASDSTEIRMGTTIEGETIVYTPQIENKAFATSITQASRDRATLSFPAERIDRYTGGISISIKPLHTYSTGILPIFYYNDSFNLVYADGNFVLTYGAQTLSIPYILTTDSYHNIAATWINGDMIRMSIEEVSDDLVITDQTIDRSSVLLIGCNPSISANAAVNKLIIHAGEIQIEYMSAYTIEQAKEDARFVINTDFSSGALNFSENKITVPNPKPMTPIIVEDEDGTVYDRVYFIDAGQYVVYDRVVKEYTGSKSFTVEYDDLFNVQAYSQTRIYNDISVIGNLITINDLSLDDYNVEDEVLTTTNNVAYYSANKNWLRAAVTVRQITSAGTYEQVDPSAYTIDYKDGLILFRKPVSAISIAVSYSYTMTPEVTIQYTPKNVFCASYDKNIDGYQILLSNTSGKSIAITYENVFGAKEKLVASVETNPFKAANNNGFVYVVSSPISVSSLDVTVTPSGLIADGNQIATITVECLGGKGTPTSNASISVSLEHGNKYGYVEEYRSTEEKQWLESFEAEKIANGEEAAIAKYGYFTTDEHISGRFIYKFHVNNITAGDKFTERIIITDTKSGIGTEVPITIVPRR
jgi:hypothetical protein